MFLKRFIVLLLVSMLLLLCGCSEKRNGSSVESSAGSGTDSSSAHNTIPAPDFTVLDQNGNEVNLSSFKGKPIILNFWATWCFYCKEEMPDFERASREYPEVQFLMVNVTDGERETVETAKTYVENNKFTFDVFFDTRLEAVNAYYVTAFPTTYFINADGNIVTRGNGMLDYNTLLKGIKLITE